MADLKYVAGAGALTTVAILFLIFNAAGGHLTSDGDKMCQTECTSYIYLTGLQHNITIVNFSKLSPNFSPHPAQWHFYLFKDGDFVETNQIENFTFMANTDYTFKLVGIKSPDSNIKWALDIGEFNIDPWWNSSDVLVNVTPSSPEQNSVMNCTGNISNYVNTTINATWTWYVDGIRNTTWDNKTTWTNQAFINTNTTFNITTSLLNHNFACCVNMSNTTYSTGFLCSQNVSVINFNYTLPSDITNISLRCLQPYMNNSEPQGQTLFVPILNLTNKQTVLNLTNITLSINALVNHTDIYANDFPQVNSNSKILNTSAQIIVKTLSGTNFTESSKGIWIYAFCNNVTDNQSVNLNFTISGGAG